MSVSLIVLLLRTTLLALPLALCLMHYRKHARFRSAVNKIPGPPTWPFIGNALHMLSTPDVLFQRGMNELAALGPLVRLWVLGEAQVIIQRARDAEKILQGMAHHTKSNSYRFLHNWMGLGLLTSNDEKWRVHRKVLTPAFHFNILHEFLPIFNKHALKLTQCLAAESLAESRQGFNIFHYSSPCSLDIICESSMGTEINAQEDHNSPYVNSVISMNDLLTKRYFSAWLRPDFLFNLSPTKREMDKHLKLLNDFTDKVITERRQYLKSLKNKNGNLDDNEDVGKRRSLAFIDLLLAAEEEGSEHMTQHDIRDQVSTFMFEGHDTVSTAMCWVLFILGTYPEHQARVVEELESVFGDSGRAPEMADLANLKYLERCIKETLRIYPSVPFFERHAKTDAPVVSENHVIPAGCTISFNGFKLHREPEFWPDPEKFDPDRFLPKNSQGRHPYAYLPFSAGPRNCIGQKFALMEEKVVVSTVLRRFRVEAAHTRDEAILQIAMVLRPKNGLHIRLFDRDSHPKLRVAG